MLSIELKGEELLLLPERAAYWPRQRTLLVADAHLGKDAAFRRHGVPVPSQTVQGVLGRLDKCVNATGAERVLFLGDLYHHASGCDEQTMTQLQGWQSRHSGLSLWLVRGNHDRPIGAIAEVMSLGQVADEVVEQPFVFRHEPGVSEGGYVLAGHVHPAATLHDIGDHPLRVPCFQFGQHYGILPAFGSFTGMHTLQPEQGARRYIVAGDQVMALQSRLTSA